MAHIGRYILAGILTVIPLWVTWLVVDFVFRQLLRIGSPIVSATREQLTRSAPELADRISWTAGEVTTTLLMPHRRGQLPAVRVVADLLIEQLSQV